MSNISDFEAQLQALSAAWLGSKELEKQAIENRRVIEDQLLELADLRDTHEGVANFPAGQYTLKITGRITRSVDSDAIQSLAAENGLDPWLPLLFRWKPELNLTAWKNADNAVKAALAGGITVKPSRPSIQIIENKE